MPEKKSNLQQELQRDWIASKLKQVQERSEYCNISLRVEKGNITVFKKEQTELLPKA